MKDNATLCFLAGGAVGAIAALSALQYLRHGDWNAAARRYDSVEDKALRAPQISSPTAGPSTFLDDEILREQFTRNVQFFGQEGQLKVASAFVVVIGLGVSMQRQWPKGSKQL